MAHISPWRPRLQNNMVIKEALRPAFNITKFITDFQFQDGYRALLFFLLYLSHETTLSKLEPIFQVTHFWPNKVLLGNERYEEVLFVLETNNFAEFSRW